MILNKSMHHLIMAGDVVSKGGSLTEAAALIKITQPALSFAIKQAEQQLGFELIVRFTKSGKRVRQITLTQKGAEFISKVKVMAKREALIMQELQENADQ